MLLPLLGFSLLGGICASFIAVISERLYTGQAWSNDRSRCNSCNTVLGARSLVPVLSWLISGGKCVACGVRVPGLYAFAEASLALLFALAYLRFGLTLVLLMFLAALSVLLFIVLYDLRHTVVPQGASMLLIIATLAFAWLTAPGVAAFGLTLMVAGGIALAFFLLFALSRGRAMGLGDAPVALGLSLLAGPFAIPGLLFSFWIGGVIGIFILVSRPKGHRMGIEVPFVPFLAAGYLLAFFTQWNPLPFFVF